MQHITLKRNDYQSILAVVKAITPDAVKAKGSRMQYIGKVWRIENAQGDRLGYAVSIDRYTLRYSHI